MPPRKHELAKVTIHRTEVIQQTTHELKLTDDGNYARYHPKIPNATTTTNLSLSERLLSDQEVACPSAAIILVTSSLKTGTCPNNIILSVQSSEDNHSENVKFRPAGKQTRTNKCSVLSQVKWYFSRTNKHATYHVLWSWTSIKTFL